MGPDINRNIVRSRNETLVFDSERELSRLGSLSAGMAEGAKDSFKLALFAIGGVLAVGCAVGATIGGAPTGGAAAPPGCLVGIRASLPIARSLAAKIAPFTFRFGTPLAGSGVAYSIYKGEEYGAKNNAFLANAYYKQAGQFAVPMLVSATTSLVKSPAPTSLTVPVSPQTALTTTTEFGSQIVSRKELLTSLPTFARSLFQALLRGTLDTDARDTLQAVQVLRASRQAATTFYGGSIAILLDLDGAPEFQQMGSQLRSLRTLLGFNSSTEAITVAKAIADDPTLRASPEKLPGLITRLSAAGMDTQQILAEAGVRKLAINNLSISLRALDLARTREALAILPSLPPDVVRQSLQQGIFNALRRSSPAGLLAKIQELQHLLRIPEADVHTAFAKAHAALYAKDSYANPPLALPSLPTGLSARGFVDLVEKALDAQPGLVPLLRQSIMRRLRGLL